MGKFELKPIKTALKDLAEKMKTDDEQAKQSRQTTLNARIAVGYLSDAPATVACLTSEQEQTILPGLVTLKSPEDTPTILEALVNLHRLAVRDCMNCSNEKCQYRAEDINV